MSDSLKNDIVDVTFVAGEQPTATKITDSIGQLKTAVSRIDQAIGDLYTEQTHVGSSGTYALSTQPLVGPNLSRYLGAAGHLNPQMIGRIRTTKVVLFVGASTTDPVTGYSHRRKRVFQLPYPPILFSSTEGTGHFLGAATSLNISYSYSDGTWAIGAPGGGYTDVSWNKVTTRVTSMANLNASGEYFVDHDGTIYTYDAIDNNEGFKVTYRFDTIWDSFDGSTLNVIPSFEQDTTLCSVSLVSGSTYAISLPTIAATETFPEDLPSGWTDSPLSYTRSDDNDQQFNHSPADVTTSADPMYGNRALLPLALRQNLSTGDRIPDGYIQIYDNDDGTILAGGEFYYQDTYKLRVVGLTLEACSDRYRIIVPGTDLSQTLAYLRESYRIHTHSGDMTLFGGFFTGRKIQHDDLLTLFDEGSTSREGFVPSTIGPTRNPHPQYFHRYGYQYGESLSDPGNVHNAFLGPFYLSNTSRAISLSADSYPIYFGATTGPRLMYDQGNDRLELYNKSLYSDEGILTSTLDATDGIGAGSDYSASRIKWFRIAKTLGSSSPDAIDITSDVPGDFNGHSTRVLGVQLTAYGTTGSLTIWRPQHGKYDASGAVADSSDAGEYNLDDTGNATFLYCPGISYDTTGAPTWTISIGYGSSNNTLNVDIVIFYIP